MDLFYEVVVDSSTPFCSNDDVASLQWIALEDVDPAQFGLHSIRRGVERLLQMYSKE
jgi:hypothetical protein